jgi:hypothetical protein
MAGPFNSSLSNLASNDIPSGELTSELAVSSGGTSFAPPNPTLTPLCSPSAPNAAAARFTWSAEGGPGLYAGLEDEAAFEAVATSFRSPE